MPVITPRLRFTPENIRNSVRDEATRRLSDAAGPHKRLRARDLQKLPPGLRAAAEALPARARTVANVTTGIVARLESRFEEINQNAGAGKHQFAKSELRKIAREQPAIADIEEMAVNRAERVAYREWGYATFGDSFIDSDDDG